MKKENNTYSEAEVEELKAQIDTLEKKLEERFHEVAVLTEQFLTMQEKIERETTVNDKLETLVNQNAEVFSYLIGNLVNIISEDLKNKPHDYKQQDLMAAVKLCGFFDEEWYQQRYPDIRKYQYGPFLHFLQCGYKEKRLPMNFVLDRKS